MQHAHALSLTNVIVFNYIYLSKKCQCTKLLTYYIFPILSDTSNVIRRVLSLGILQRCIYQYAKLNFVGSYT